MAKPLTPDDAATFNAGVEKIKDLTERLTFRGFTCKVKKNPSNTKLALRVGRADPNNGSAMQLTGLGRIYTLAQLKNLNVDAEEDSIASDSWGVDIPPALTTFSLTLLADVEGRMKATEHFFKRTYPNHKVLTWERYAGTVRPYMEETAHFARALLAGKKPSP